MALNHDKFASTYADQFFKLLNYLRVKCQNYSEAEDLAQESFTKLWVNREKVEEGKETSFLYTIANNLFIDTKRKEQVKMRYISSLPSHDNYENPEFIFRTKEFHSHVNDRIQSLPEKSREVFVMNKIDKLTYGEIASKIGLSVKSVEKRMTVALKVYRELRKI